MALKRSAGSAAGGKTNAIDGEGARFVVSEPAD